MTAAAAAAKLLQSRPTLCDPIDSSPPGSLVPGILQARTLEWLAISFSSNMTRVIRTGRRGHRHRRRDGPAQMLGEDGRPQARERQGTGPSLTALSRNQPCGHRGLPVSRIRRK